MSSTTPTPVRTPLSVLGGPDRNPWVGRLVFLAAVALLALVPTIVDDPTRTRQWAEYLCYAALAVGIDIAWGYGGMLVLGQGLFFGLGAYAMGMHLSLEQVGPGELPRFMALYGDQTELPLVWRPFESLGVTLVLALAIPMAIAGLFGWLVFSRRVRGPYFALLTQAMALIFTLIMIGQLKTFAGTNGLTDFQTVFGRNKYAPSTNTFLYGVAAVVLVAVFLVGRQLVRSRFGRLLVAPERDAAAVEQKLALEVHLRIEGPDLAPVLRVERDDAVQRRAEVQATVRENRRPLECRKLQRAGLVQSADPIGPCDLQV